MKRNFRRKMFIPAVGTLLLIACVAGGWHWYIRSPGYGLPYHVPFLMEAQDRWTALGGSCHHCHTAGAGFDDGLMGS